ncbi:hypothetical protein H9Q69_005008 [Fusarium xylarioides]|uniref:Uncharacterized protein n=1 Tax=Fusarium xylarioides TaxID=221167 RepID=A0A9P7HNS5_9HYPO|nr:hypothetical protein H9Q70_012273 [Fusarium xylarioides]KAG5760424.1 hypothetical protein H9Q72_011472 [Fusarium xylarioides]KAG5773584.1 hypothetical protein H9Q73_012024 [Fusarium xylarioides]KAG5795932.1 hypothetical protein H9Q69_005008 [Fusarium xylarioides]KAG5804699.1 hypothetical protein H9Q71_010734 [Fusarium xylarioides]
MESSSEPPKKKLKETHYPSNQEFNYSFLEAISSQCTLLFKSPASLEQFAAKAASALPQPGSGEITMRRLLIELDVFREDQLPNASDLEEWKRLQCPHGFPQGAREHFEEWMNAVQKVLELGFTLHVTIRCRKPFRDYVSFREQSSVLRDPKVTVEIDLDKAAWSQVPQHYRPLLMAMVEFSITGVQLEKELEDQRVGLANKEEWYLNRHGCLVVRGLRVHTYQQTSAMDGQPLLSRAEHPEGRYREDEQRS